MRLSIGMNYYRFTREDKTIRPYTEQLIKCAEGGFRVMDISCASIMRPAKNDPFSRDDWEKTAHEVRELADKIGIDISQSHAPFNFAPAKHADEPDYVERFHDAIDRAIRISAIVGVKQMVTHPFNTLKREGAYNPEQLQRDNIEFFARHIELADKLGVGIAFENMLQSGIAWADNPRYCALTDELISLIDTINAPHVGACWDFGHAHIACCDKTCPMTDHADELRKLGKRLRSTHVHDNSGTRDLHQLPFVGGNIEWEKLMPVLREIGYEGDFTYESAAYVDDMPAPLRDTATKFAYDVGMYLLGLCDK